MKINLTATDGGMKAALGEITMSTASLVKYMGIFPDGGSGGTSGTGSMKFKIQQADSASGATAKVTMSSTGITASTTGQVTVTVSLTSGSAEPVEISLTYEVDLYTQGYNKGWEDAAGTIKFTTTDTEGGGGTISGPNKSKPGTGGYTYYTWKPDSYIASAHTDLEVSATASPSTYISSYTPSTSTGKYIQSSTNILAIGTGYSAVWTTVYKSDGNNPPTYSSSSLLELTGAESKGMYYAAGTLYTPTTLTLYGGVTETTAAVTVSTAATHGYTASEHTASTLTANSNA